MKTTFFNLEEVAVGATTLDVYDGGFIEALRTATLDISYEENPYPVFNVMRGAVMAKKFSLRPTARLLEYSRRIAGPVTIKRIMQMQQLHYGREFVSAGEFETLGVGSTP